MVEYNLTPDQFGEITRIFVTSKEITTEEMVKVNLQWNELIQEASLKREKRQILTENIVAVSNMIGMYNKLIKYNTKDGLIKKPEGYPFAYPDLLFFMQTGGSYIDQVLCEMYMKHRMRTYQAFFHVNPDYAYWYGWEMLVKDLGEIKKLAKGIRADAAFSK